MAPSSASSNALVGRTHVVPTHVHTPDVLLNVAGVGISVRQFLLLLVGIALGYQGWLALAWLTAFPGGWLGQVIRAVGVLLPLGLSLAFAFVTLAGRELDDWCVVLVRYLLRPRFLVWRTVRFQEPSVGGWTADSEELEEGSGEQTTI